MHNSIDVPRWNVQFLPTSACFSHLGSPISLQSTDGNYYCAKCEHWQLSTQRADAGVSCSWTHAERVGDCTFTSRFLSSFFGNLVCNKPCTSFDTARALGSLPAVCSASIPKGAHSVEVWSVSQAIKESVNRKMGKPNWDWKHSLPLYLPYVSSWLIL